MPCTQAEHCREKAAECEEEAKRAPSESLAETWLHFVKQWREMADRIEKNLRVKHQQE